MSRAWIVVVIRYSTISPKGRGRRLPPRLNRKKEDQDDLEGCDLLLPE